MNIDVPF